MAVVRLNSPQGTLDTLLRRSAPAARESTSAGSSRRHGQQRLRSRGGAAAGREDRARGAQRCRRQGRLRGGAVELAPPARSTAPTAWAPAARESTWAPTSPAARARTTPRARSPSSPTARSSSAGAPLLAAPRTSRWCGCCSPQGTLDPSFGADGHGAAVIDLGGDNEAGDGSPGEREDRRRRHRDPQRSDGSGRDPPAAERHARHQLRRPANSSTCPGTQQVEGARARARREDRRGRHHRPDDAGGQRHVRVAPRGRSAERRRRPAGGGGGGSKQGAALCRQARDRDRHQPQEPPQGHQRADVIVALGGNDTIDGRGGNDIICAGNGNDKVAGGDGKDRIFGESGKDRIERRPGNDSLDGGPGNDRLSGQSGKDTLRGRSGRDRLSGGPGKDKQKQ